MTEAAKDNATNLVEITVEDKKGVRHGLQFDLSTSTLTWADTGTRVALDRIGLKYLTRLEPWAHELATDVNPQRPARKSGSKRLIKIQLGLNCNFSCVYCAQEPQQGTTGNKTIPIFPVAGKAPRESDVDTFLANLPNWLEVEDGVRFELWGGEPFLYWRAFRPLAEGLLLRYPKAIVSTVTNASLINKDIHDWVVAQDNVHLAISHDGPGVHRDHDVLDNPWLQALYRTLSKTARPLTFNAVLTAGNLSMAKIRAYIAERLQVPPAEIRLSTEGLITPFDESSMALLPDVDQMREVFMELVTQQSLFAFGPDLNDFFQAIAQQRPLGAVQQKCGLDRPDAVVVNLKTQDIVTCQNTLPIGEHRIGHVDRLDEAALDTVFHWKSRPQCGTCPVLSFCRGSCLYLKGDDFARACESQFRYRLPFLCAAIYFLTGFIPVRLSWAWGDIELNLLERKTCSA